MSHVVVDSAGGAFGGARRFLDEMDDYLGSSESDSVRVVGRGRSLSPAWLVRRERQHRRAARTVALNNVAFSYNGRERWVLLRNALHFLAPDEKRALGARLPRHVRMQIPVVHRTAARADLIVAPSEGMRDRIVRTLPAVADRTVVRAHPTSPLEIHVTPRRGTFLCPIVIYDFKRMEDRLQNLAAAATLLAEHTAEPVRLVVTATVTELASTGLAAHPHVSLVGRLTTLEVQEMAAESSAVIYPTQIESFGYPLAEARVNRWPIIAPGTAHHREVAGDALVPYDRETPEELADAMRRALDTALPPARFDDLDPKSYFEWLLAASPR